MPSSNWNLRSETSASTTTSTTDVSGLDSTRFDPINHRLEESNNEEKTRSFLRHPIFSFPPFLPPYFLPLLFHPRESGDEQTGANADQLVFQDAPIPQWPWSTHQRKILIRRRYSFEEFMTRATFHWGRDFLLLFWSLLVRWTLNGKREVFVKRFLFVSCKFFLREDKVKLECFFWIKFEYIDGISWK